MKKYLVHYSQPALSHLVHSERKGVSGPYDTLEQANLEKQRLECSGEIFFDVFVSEVDDED